MKKLLRFVITLLLGIVMGYYFRDQAILADTWFGDRLQDISDFLPIKDPEAITDLSTEATSEAGTHTSFLSQIFTKENIDTIAIEENIFSQLNELRQEKGLSPLQENEQLNAAARQRAIESETSFSHTRPDGSPTFTILTEADYYYPYTLAGENLGMASFIKDENYMADVLFQGWMDSPDHYEAMINPDFKEVGVGVYANAGVLYAVQYFGSPIQ